MQTKVKEDVQRLASDKEKATYRLLTACKHVSMTRLSRTLELDPRQVRRLIELMRMKGLRIGSSHKGYYLIKSDAEYAEFEKSYLNGAFTRLLIAKAMRENNEGQVYVDE